MSEPQPINTWRDINWYAPVDGSYDSRKWRMVRGVEIRNPDDLRSAKQSHCLDVRVDDETVRVKVVNKWRKRGFALGRVLTEPPRTLDNNSWLCDICSSCNPQCSTQCWHCQAKRFWK